MHYMDGTTWEAVTWAQKHAEDRVGGLRVP